MRQFHKFDFPHAAPDYRVLQGPANDRNASNYQQARHRSIQERRSHGQVPLSLESAADDVRALMESLQDIGPNPHELAERHETQVLIRAAIATLPPDQADAILLRFGGDLPIQEIAIAMKRTEGAIKSLIHRGLVILRKTLQEESVRGGVIEARRRASLHQDDDTTVNKHHGTHIEL